MVAPLAVATPVKGLGIVVVAVAAAAVLVVRPPRLRAIAALVALLLTPALVLAELWHSTQVSHLRAHTALALAAAILAVGLMVALAALFTRRPAALPLLATATLPFRIPVQSGTSSANLLVPLYVVVGAGVLAYAWERLGPPARAAGRAAGGNGSSTLTTWQERSPSAIDYALVAAVVLYALQAAYSADFDQAVKNVTFFYVPFLLLFKLLTTVRWSRRLMVGCFGVSLVLALVFAGVGFIEYGTRHLLWNQKVIASDQFESYFRVNSLFFDPSIYGRFLAIVMVALAATLIWPRRIREVAYTAAVLAVLWGGLLFSFSQSSFVALLVGLALLAGLRWDPRPVLFGTAVVVVAGLVVVAVKPSIINLNLGSNSSVNKASSGRFKLVRGGLRMLGERPVWGYGSGSFSTVFRTREQVGASAAASASHTIPLTVGAEQGVIGLAAYLFLVVVSFRLLFRGLGGLRGRAPPGWSLVARAVVAAAYGALWFHTLLYADFLEDPIAWALLAVGVVLAHPEPLVSGDRSGVLPARIRSFISR